MIDDWQWDPTLFLGTATHYEQGRLPYAPGFAEALASSLGLDGQGRLLDAGCGIGTATLPLAAYFAEAVGLDPDQDMLAEAGRRSRRLGVGNVRWVLARAEDLPAGLGTFRVVLFALSFHWTERDQVAATALDMLAPGGAFVHMSDRKEPPVEPLPHRAIPKAEIGELVRRHLGPVRRAGQGFLPNGTPDREDLVMERAGFRDFERRFVPGGQVIERTVDDIVALVFSKWETAPHLFGAALGDFERELRALLGRALPEHGYAELLPDTEILIGRKPAAAR